MFAVVHIPDFALQAALRHEPELRDAPVALANGEAAKALVSEVTLAAEKFGVGPGMTATQAKARCDRIVFRVRSLQQEETAQEILLECAYCSAAYIESTALGVCTIDLRGLPILKMEPFGPRLEQWAEQLRGRLEQLYLSARIGVAGTPTLAAQAARGDAPFCYVTDPAKFWGKLSVHSLSAAPRGLDILSKWGIHKVGQFLALGAKQIAERLGSAGVELFDQAKSKSIRPLRLTAPRQNYEEFFQFEQVVEALEPLLFVVRRLLEQLVVRLELVSMSFSEILLSLQLESGKVHQNSIKIASPTRDTSVLFRIAYNYLETVRTTSPVAAVTMRAKPCEVETEQLQLFETSVRDPNRFYETIGRLSALLGPGRVGTPKVRDSFRADDFELVRASSPRESKTADSGMLVDDAQKRLSRKGLPLRRFRPPVSASVRLKESCPVFIDSPGPSGSIARSQGPWRRSGNWWENLWVREEWDIQMKDGALYQIFLENDRWFVDGAYD